jgi:glycosyltransferase involved in cell wall biosynthesis
MTNTIPSILYVTNLLNHHQYPLAIELSKNIGIDNFRLAVMQPMRDERAELGWKVEEDIPCWVIEVYKSKLSDQEYFKWLRDSDVVITGLLNMQDIKPRIEAGKLTMYMSERWWKPSLMNTKLNTVAFFLSYFLKIDKGMIRLLSPSFAWNAFQLSRLSKNKCFHYLAIGSKAAVDMSYISSFNNRMWQWGYFTTVNPINLPYRSNNPVKIMWAGRMLKWKRTETLIAAANILKRKGVKFSLEIIGLGCEKLNLMKFVNNLNLSDFITFFDPVSPNKVISKMKKNDIYVLTSSGSEGWGAVVNEAMSCGCVVVASREAGVSEVLIRDKKTGFLFREGDEIELADILELLINDSALRQKIGRAAIDEIGMYWCPAVVATRLINHINEVLGKSKMSLLEHGPLVSLSASSLD